MIFLDTNIFLRYLTKDDPVKFKACFKLLQEKKHKFITSPQVTLEIIWVLEKYYKYPKAKIVDCVLKILNTSNLECEQKTLLESSLVLWLRKGADFVDVFNACYIKEKGLDTIYSYDTDFDQLDIKRLEP